MPKGVYTRKARVPRTCEQCGTVKMVHASAAKRGQYRFCDRACYEASRAPAPKPPRPEPIDPLIANVSRGEGCWEWTGPRYPNGYGSVHHDYAHRLAWVRASGQPIPEGFGVYHVCDNPPCTRNDDKGTYEVDGRLLSRWGHLFLGTDADNAADKVAKGRQLKGEQIHGARLTAAQIPDIRQRLAAREPMHQIAAVYGVSRGAIQDIAGGRTWRHLM